MQENPLRTNEINGNTLNLNVPESSKENYYNKYGLRHNCYKFQDFEDYLMTVFGEGDGACILDDDFPEAYDVWIEDLEHEDYVRFANIYGKLKKGEINEKRD